MFYFLVLGNGGRRNFPDPPLIPYFHILEALASLDSAGGHPGGGTGVAEETQAGMEQGTP